jgi:hypothetical protein
MTAARRGGKRVGCIRASTVDQNIVRPLDRIEFDKTYTDRASGANTTRPQPEPARGYLRNGDVPVIHSMDWFAWNIH